MQAQNILNRYTTETRYHEPIISGGQGLIAPPPAPDTSAPAARHFVQAIPNPASEFLNVFLKDTALPQRKDARLRIVNAQGRILRDYSAGRLDEVTYMIPVEGLPGGLYFLQYTEEGRTLGAERFVKE